MPCSLLLCITEGVQSTCREDGCECPERHVHHPQKEKPSQLLIHQLVNEQMWYLLVDCYQILKHKVLTEWSNTVEPWKCYTRDKKHRIEMKMNIVTILAEHHTFNKWWEKYTFRVLKPWAASSAMLPTSHLMKRPTAASHIPFKCSLDTWKYRSYAGL